MQWSDVVVGTLERMPKNLVSRAFGAVSEVELPGPLQRAVNHSFLAVSGADIAECEEPPECYDSLNDLFTRRLRAGSRPVEVADDGGLLSPVDGTLGAFGRIDDGELFQAKGRRYGLLELVDSAEERERFTGGWYATIYLAPGDYHRIHSPVSGRVRKIGYIPGQLFPVNPFAVHNVDDLFAINERLITYLDTGHSEVAVIKVGATCVGRIELLYEKFETNGSFRRRREFAPERRIELAAGDELAVFNLGSTVIVLVDDPGFGFADELREATALRVGQRLGAATAR